MTSTNDNQQHSGCGAPDEQHDGDNSLEPERHADGTGDIARALPVAEQCAPMQAKGSQGVHMIANPRSRRVTQADFLRLRKHKQRRKVLMVALALFVVALVGGTISALMYYQNVSKNLHADAGENLQDALIDTSLLGNPFYVLLLGTSGSNERAASEEHAGDSLLMDSIVLARIDPPNRKMTIVSVHCGAMVDRGEYGISKLNAAYALGGAASAMEVVSQFAGVPISHYVEIDCDGFSNVVNTLDGIEVNVPMTIDDEDAGGHVDAGPQTLDGNQALILCRARNAYDGYGDGDTYCAANQRLVLAAIAQKVLSADIGTMAGTVRALAQYVTTDFEVDEMVALAQNLRGLDPKRDIYSAMEPTTSQLIDDVWWEIANEDEWRTMMARVDQGLSPTTADVVDEASGTILAVAGDGGVPAVSAADGTITVSVLNGAGIAGIANSAAMRMQSLGYTTQTGNTKEFGHATTIVVYDDASMQPAAESIVNALGVGELHPNDGSYSLGAGVDVLVIVGSDWA